MRDACTIAVTSTLYLGYVLVYVILSTRVIGEGILLNRDIFVTQALRLLSLAVLAYTRRGYRDEQMQLLHG